MNEIQFWFCWMIEFMKAFAETAPEPCEMVAPDACVKQSSPLLASVPDP